MLSNNGNRCSFIVYPNKRRVYTYNALYTYNETANLRKKWIIIEIYKCPDTFRAQFETLFGIYNCFRQFNVYFNPQSMNEILSMAGSVTKIIRKAPYNNKTLTINIPSAQRSILWCSLILREQDSRWSQASTDNFKIYEKGQINFSSSERWIEYIGDKDNSCSFRVQLDVINKTSNIQDKLFNRHWWIYVTYEDDNSFWTPEFASYKFFMNSLSWWQINHFSNVFLTRRPLFSIDVQHY